MSKQDQDCQSVTLTKLWVCLSVQLSVDCDRLVKQVNQQRASKYYAGKKKQKKNVLIAVKGKLLIKLFFEFSL